MTLSERNTIALQAYYDEGFIELPAEALQAEPEPECGLYLIPRIKIALLCAFAFIMGVCAGMALA